MFQTSNYDPVVFHRYESGKIANIQIFIYNEKTDQFQAVTLSKKDIEDFYQIYKNQDKETE